MGQISDTLLHDFRTNKKIQEFLRFCIVGAICTAIDACIFYLVRLFASYNVALDSGYCLSLIVNYYLTIHWTFQTKANAKNTLGVIAAHLFNLFVVRTGLMFLFVEVMGISDGIAFIPTFIISSITNFFIVRFVVTKR